MNELTLYGLTFAGSLLASHLITWQYRRYALRKGVMDHPNERSSHIQPTPRGGGISIVIICSLLILLGMASNQVDLTIAAAILACTLTVAVIGLIDDHRHINSLIRLSVHLAACLAGLTLLPELPDLNFAGKELAIGTVGIIFSTLALAWLINLYNFMDGIDGIASIEAISVLAGATLILGNNNAGEALLLVILMAPVAGFLIWNWSPAKIFMGDGCSGYLGAMFGLLAFHLASTTILNLWGWAILLGVFIVDASWTLTTRIITRQPWHQPHRSHCYQILAREYKSHSKVSLIAGTATLLWLTPMAALACHKPNWGIALLLIAYFPLCYICAIKKAGRV